MLFDCHRQHKWNPSKIWSWCIWYKISNADRSNIREEFPEDASIRNWDMRLPWFCILFQFEIEIVCPVPCIEAATSKLKRKLRWLMADYQLALQIYWWCNTSISDRDITSSGLRPLLALVSQTKSLSMNCWLTTKTSPTPVDRVSDELKLYRSFLLSVFRCIAFGDYI